MGVWCAAEFEVLFSASSGLSPRKLVESELSEAVVNEYTQTKVGDAVHAKFHVTFGEEGLDAANELRRVLNLIKKKDPTSYTDVNANIRF